MAAATNTTLGEIKLSGDLLASNANAPTLRPSGVKSGTYNVTDKIYVDAQGRITWAKQLPGDFTWPVATKTSYGIFQIGVTPDPNNNSIDISNGVISVNKATATDAGVVKIGSGLLINGTSGATEVNVPEATSLVFGACRPDNTTTEVDVNGTLSINGQALIDDAGPASASNLGGVKVGARLSVTDGVIDTDWNLATGATLGTVIVGDNFSVNAGILSANEASTTVNGVIQVSDSFWIDPADSDINIRQTHYNYWGHLYGISGSNIFLDDPTSTLSCNYSFSDFSGDATASVLGKVQVGDRIDVDGNGVISVPMSSGSVHGVFKVAGRTFKVVNNALTYDRNYPASATYYGHVKPDGNTIVFSDQPTSTIATNLSAFPNASTTAKGYVQVGSGLAITSGVLSIPNATESTAGAIQVGSGLTINNGTLSLNIPDATTSSKGAVQIGTGFKIDSETGVMLAPYANEYGTATFGVVKCDSSTNLKLVDGILSCEFNEASETEFGLVKPDNVNIFLNGSSQIYSVVPNATNSTHGFVRADGDSTWTSAGGWLHHRLASTLTYGVVGAGTGIDITEDGIMSLADASTSTKGIMQPGFGLDVNLNGVISINNDGISAKPNVTNAFVTGNIFPVNKQTTFGNFDDNPSIIMFAPATFDQEDFDTGEGSEEGVVAIEVFGPGGQYDPAITPSMAETNADFTNQKVYVIYKVINVSGTFTPVKLRVINKTGVNTTTGHDSPVMGEGCSEGDLIVFEYIKLKKYTNTYGLFFKSATIYSN